MKMQGDGSAESQQETGEEPDCANFSNPLPCDEGTFQDSPLGAPQEWPKSLQSFATTLTSFAYPAVIFWGEECVLLHNKAWSDAGGVDQQGQPQRGKLTPDAWKTLQSARIGGQPRRLASHELMRGDSDAEAPESYTILVSPLFEDGEDAASGLLAQLLPKPHVSSGSSQSPQGGDDKASFGNNAMDKDQKQGSADLSELGGAVDNVPLDEHPYV